MENKPEPDERMGLPSASSMKRTRRCPGWMNLARTLVAVKGGVDADAGTARHSLIELDVDPESLSDSNEAYTVAQSARLREDAVNAMGWAAGEVVEVKEQRLWVFDGEMKRLCSAKMDHILINGETALVLDYKTLFGNHGHARNNEQLMTGVVAIADHYGVTRVRVALIQPNLPKEQQLTQAEYNEDDINYARKEVIAWCAASTDPDAPRIPGAIQCDFCPARAHCPEAIAAGSFLAKFDIKTGITPAIMPLLLEKCIEADGLTKAIRAHAKVMLEAGEVINGWMLKPGNETRKVTDPAKLAGLLSNVGATSDEISAIATIALGAAENLYKEKTGLTAARAKKRLDEELASCDAVKKTQNQPSLTQI